MRAGALLDTRVRRWRLLLLAWRRLRRAVKKIAVVPGDGIGPEVMDEAIKVLDAGADHSPASRRALRCSAADLVTALGFPPPNAAANPTTFAGAQSRA